MRIAFIDLETTGLPKQPRFDEYYSYTQLKFYDNARIVQIAVVIYDIDETTNTERKRVTEHTYIIKPDGFEIRNSHIHRISHAMALFAGVPFKEVMEKIMPDLFACDVFIAHNILFDRNVLLSELHRYNMINIIYKINSMKYFCTSKGCKNITKIRYNASEFKQPKLSELYKFLFKKEMLDAHDALVDTNVLIECFMELRKRRLVVYFNGEFHASCDL